MRNFFVLSLWLWMSFAWGMSPRQMLISSGMAFDKGQYKEALKLIKDLDIRNDLDNSDDMKTAFKIRAIAYGQTGEEEKARETIRELYFLDAGYNFDAFDTPASVVVLAREEKLLIEEKNRHLANIKPVEPVLEPETVTREIDKKPHIVTTLFPFGLNHFSLNSPLKGSIYLSVQGLGVLTNISAFWWKQSYLSGFGSNRLKDPTLRPGFQAAQIIQYVGFGTMVAGFLVSVIDALIQFNRTEPRILNTKTIN